MAGLHRRSPLAVVLLVLLEEEPMHAYRMRRLIKERAKDQVVNVDRPNSVYQSLDRLQRAGLIEVRGTTRDENRPERTVYQITDEGRETLYGWLRAILSTPAREFPELPAALASVALLTPEEVAGELTKRVSALESRLAAIDVGTRTVEEMGLPRVFSLEDEYQRTMTEAELKWARSLIDDLRNGRLAWIPPDQAPR